MIGDLILFLFWQHEGEAKNVYLWLRKRLPGGQSLVSPLLLPPAAPPCAGRLNDGSKHCHVPSCTRHKLRSRSSVRVCVGGGGCALDSWREVDGVRVHLPGVI